MGMCEGLHNYGPDLTFICPTVLSRFKEPVINFTKPYIADITKIATIPHTTLDLNSFISSGWSLFITSISIFQRKKTIAALNISIITGCINAPIKKSTRLLKSVTIAIETRGEATARIRVVLINIFFISDINL